ncbi:MAG: DUF4258 domain-containing protein [Promethearchaeota archaeon]
MPIIYTKHALSRMKIRNISSLQVEQTVNEANQINLDNFGNNIAQKQYGSYLIRVIFKVENKNKLIITAYRTSKIERYLS